jgi:ABC-type Fe3+ transport system substrate-binding protein
VATRGLCILLAVLAALAVGGCRSDQGVPEGPKRQRAQEEIRGRWGRGFDELPSVTLRIISPHNENIKQEYEWAFSLYHARKYGRKVSIDWRTVGGGSSSIERYLLNVYGRAQTSQIDIVWGGGEFTFRALDREGILVPLALPPETLDAVPRLFGGVEMYPENLSWIGSAVSGFGFIYNRGLLEMCRIAPPTTWQDLALPRFADRLVLADPTQSGSVAAAYRMIVVSSPSWPEGWKRLLLILANAKRFTDSAGTAANAPLMGDALVSACIDFYGALRVAEAPDQMVYVSPRGQTTFSPDPIAILKNPPNEELARRFVEFVLSKEGQALWALGIGAPHGPMRSVLGRQPIRRDVYHLYDDQLLPWIVNPYESGQALVFEADNARMNRVNFGVLRALVGAAAIDNPQGLRSARARLVQTNYDPKLLAEFVELPVNVASLEAMSETATRLKDPTQRELILTGWQDYFRQKYRRVAR